MSTKVVTVVQGLGAILILDSLGSLVVRVTGLGVGYGSLLVFLAVGLVGGWRDGILLGTVAGAVVAAAHGSVGWSLSAWLGPASIGETYAAATPIDIALNAVTLALVGAIVGSLGAVVGRWLRRRQVGLRPDHRSRPGASGGSAVGT